MKRVYFILIAFLLAMMCGNVKAQLPKQITWSEYAAEEFESGDGTEKDPYIIVDGAQLAYMALLVRDNPDEYGNLHYQLGANIDLIGSRRWDVPIGTKDAPFAGTFDGVKYTIYNMSSSNKDDDYLGLFGQTTDPAVIRNVTIENAQISGNLISGSLIGYADGTSVENCHVKNCQITNVTNSAGCFIGAAVSTTIENCSSSGKIACDAEYTGGFIGIVRDVELIYCFSEGSVIGITVGGFIGCIEAGKNSINSIQNCYSTCKIFGITNVGGFIGNVLSEAEMTGCRASGSVTGSMSNVGGFIGHIDSPVNIENCLAEGQVTGVSGYVGGFIGIVGNTGTTNSSVITVSDCRSTGAVEAYAYYAGGFIGYFSNYNNTSSFTGCAAEGPVSGQNSVGGFIGYTAFACSISQCYAYGAVEGIDVVGGFGGRLFGTVADCFSVGAVKGNERVGGFVGNMDFPSTVTGCYSVGTVKGNDIVGGFNGYISASNLTDCYAAGTVFCEDPDGEIQRGAFFGERNGVSTFTNCYFDQQTAELVYAQGAFSVAGIEGKPTSELTKSSLTGFSDRWVFTEGFYPQLKAFAKSDDAATQLRSALSAVPFKVAETETVGDVQKIVYLDKTTPSTGDAITWTANPEENATVVNHALYAKASDAWRTLTLRAGDAQRTVQFRSTKNLMTADVLDIKVNNISVVPETIKDINNTGEYTYPIGCSTDELATTSVYVEITLGDFVEIIINDGYSSYNPVFSMTLYANQPQTVTVTTDDGQSKKYTFTAEKPLPQKIFIQRWYDVLTVDNNFVTNGGYIFTDYQWYKNGTLISGATKGYFQEQGGLLRQPTEYKVMLTTQEGDKLSTCPAYIDDMKTKMAIYPNPVQRGQSVRVETGIGGDAARHASTTAVMQLFDVSGIIVTKQTLNDPVAEIAMPDTPGQYILRVTVNGVGQTFKIVVE